MIDMRLMVFVVVVCGFMLVPGVSAVHPFDKCILGDLKCGDDLKTVSYCWDENGDGVLDWTRNPKNQFKCMLPCKVKEGDFYIEAWHDGCFEDHPRAVDGGSKYMVQDVCRDFHYICSEDGHTIVRCNSFSTDSGYMRYEFFDNDVISQDWKPRYCTFGCHNEFDNLNYELGRIGKCNPSISLCFDQECDYEGQIDCYDDDYYVTCQEQEGFTECFEYSDVLKKCDYGCGEFDDGDRCNPVPVDPNAYVTDEYTWALFHFDDGLSTGIFYDTSGNGHNFSSGAPFGIYVNDSKYGGYAYQYKAFGPLLLETPGYIREGTVEWWFKFNDDYENDHNSDAATFGFYMINEDSGWDYIDVRLYPEGTFLVSGRLGQGTYYIEEYWPFGQRLNGNEWHHIMFTWDNEEIIGYFDKKFIGEVTKVGDPPEVNTSDIRYGIAGGINNGGDYLYIIDEFRISTVKRDFSDNCVPQCYEEDKHHCYGIQIPAKSVRCFDSDLDGCLDLKDKGSDCPDGCHHPTGTCYADSSAGIICNKTGIKKCGEGREWDYEYTCGQWDDHGHLSWKVDNDGWCRGMGCNPDTGECVPVRDVCEVGETFCCDDPAVDSIADPGRDGICNCTDGDGDGYLDYKYNVIKDLSCGQFGSCHDDRYVGNESNHAWCSYPITDEMIEVRNQIHAYKWDFLTMFSSPMIRNIVSILIIGFVFGLVSFLSRSSTMGGLAAIMFVALFMYSGWLPGVLAVLISLLAASTIIQQIMRRGE